MLTAGSALLGGPIAAQTPPPQAPAGQQPPSPPPPPATQPPAQPPEEPGKYEETVVVSASRTEETLINAPATMSVITVYVLSLCAANANIEKRTRMIGVAINTSNPN